MCVFGAEGGGGEFGSSVVGLLFMFCFVEDNAC